MRWRRGSGCLIEPRHDSLATEAPTVAYLAARDATLRGVQADRNGMNVQQGGEIGYVEDGRECSGGEYCGVWCLHGERYPPPGIIFGNLQAHATPPACLSYAGGVATYLVRVELLGLGVAVRRVSCATFSSSDIVSGSPGSDVREIGATSPLFNLATYARLSELARAVCSA